MIKHLTAKVVNIDSLNRRMDALETAVESEHETSLQVLDVILRQAIQKDQGDRLLIPMNSKLLTKQNRIHLQQSSSSLKHSAAESHRQSAQHLLSSGSAKQEVVGKASSVAAAEKKNKFIKI